MHIRIGPLATLAGVVVWIGAASLPPLAETGSAVQHPGPAPPVIEQLGPTGDLIALAIAPDGLRALVARNAGAGKKGTKPQTRVELISTSMSEGESLVIPGLIRDLLFARDGSFAYGIRHKPAKRREGDTDLVQFHFAPLKMKRLFLLPSTARSIDHFLDDDALFVASENSIRTLLFPGPRSGPLYRILGKNLSLASVGGGTLVLVGQQDRLALVELSDPPGKETMPVREWVPSPSPIVALAIAADGSGGLARTADGGLAAVEFRPLRLIPRGQAAAVAVAPLRHSIDVSGLAAPNPDLQPAPEPPEVATEPPSAAMLSADLLGAEAEDPPRTDADDPAPHRPPEPSAAEPPTAEPSAAEPPAPQPSSTAPAMELPAAADDRPEAPRLVEPQSPPAEIQPDMPPAAEPQGHPRATGERAPPSEPGVHGRLSGPLADQVESIVLFGPNNILVEAARIAPDDDGRWFAPGLAAGRYRIQVDAGGKLILLSAPASAIVELEEGQTLEAPEFRVLRKM